MDIEATHRFSPIGGNEQYRTDAGSVVELHGPATGDMVWVTFPSGAKRKVAYRDLLAL